MLDILVTAVVICVQPSGPSSLTAAVTFTNERNTLIFAEARTPKIAIAGIPDRINGVAKLATTARPPNVLTVVDIASIVEYTSSHVTLALFFSSINSTILNINFVAPNARSAAAPKPTEPASINATTGFIPAIAARAPNAATTVPIAPIVMKTSAQSILALFFTSRSFTMPNTIAVAPRANAST